MIEQTGGDRKTWRSLRVKLWRGLLDRDDVWWEPVDRPCRILKTRLLGQSSISSARPSIEIAAVSGELM